MTLLNQLSVSSSSTFGPVALATVAILTTALIARGGHSRSAAPTSVRRRLGLPKGVARWFLIGALAVAVLVVLGINFEGLWSTIGGALSLVAIGFVAMWSILSHMLASILIVIFRPFEVGDRVEIVSDEPVVVGEVTDLNPVYTTLRADDGGTLRVPNNLFFQKTLKRHAPPASPGSAQSPSQA